jgi:hypothetical protein
MPVKKACEGIFVSFRHDYVCLALTYNKLCSEIFVSFRHDYVCLEIYFSKLHFLSKLIWTKERDENSLGTTILHTNIIYMYLYSL